MAGWSGAPGRTLPGTERRSTTSSRLLGNALSHTRTQSAIHLLSLSCICVSYSLFHSRTCRSSDVSPCTHLSLTYTSHCSSSLSHPSLIYNVCLSLTFTPYSMFPCLACRPVDVFYYCYLCRIYPAVVYLFLLKPYHHILSHSSTYKQVHILYYLSLFTHIYILKFVLFVRYMYISVCFSLLHIPRNHSSLSDSCTHTHICVLLFDFNTHTLLHFKTSRSNTFKHSVAISLFSCMYLCKYISLCVCM